MKVINIITMECPFCKKRVKDENAALVGCEKCIKKWIKEKNINQPVA